MGTPYKPLEAIQLLRPAFRTTRVASQARLFSASRALPATHNSTTSSSPPPPPPPQRRSVTVTNDTGAVRWGDLSVGEKAARTTQQTVNFGIIIAGVVLTGGVAYFLFQDVFSPNSKTAYFNRCTDRVRQSPECQKLLGPSSQISAHGEQTWSRWAHNRHISSTTETDKWGTEHMKFRFYVEGPLGHGVVNCHLTKRPSQDEYEYALLAVDVKGHPRVYLENADERKNTKVAPKIFGARWW